MVRESVPSGKGGGRKSAGLRLRRFDPTSPTNLRRPNVYQQSPSCIFAPRLETGGLRHCGCAGLIVARRLFGERIVSNEFRLDRLSRPHRFSRERRARPRFARAPSRRARRCDPVRGHRPAAGASGQSRPCLGAGQSSWTAGAADTASSRIRCSRRRSMRSASRLRVSPAACAGCRRPTVRPARVST